MDIPRISCFCETNPIYPFFAKPTHFDVFCQTNPNYLFIAKPTHFAARAHPIAAGRDDKSFLNRVRGTDYQFLFHALYRGTA